MNQKETATPISTKKLTPKKQVRQEIAEALTGALSAYKQNLGEKKLATHVKMVSKLISRDLEKAGKKLKEQKTKETRGKKKTAGKAPKKSAKKIQEKSEVK
ncbi:hypothetical protein ACX0G9_19445 [Flavitalea flava]